MAQRANADDQYVRSSSTEQRQVSAGERQQCDGLTLEPQASLTRAVHRPVNDGTTLEKTASCPVALQNSDRSHKSAALK
jgi:hypothetical protein